MSDQEIEQKKELKDLSKECQKAVKQFKAYLKKHVKKDFSNVSATLYSLAGEEYGYSEFITNGQLKNLSINFKIKLDCYDRFKKIDTIFYSFCDTLNVGEEESDLAFKLMGEKNFWFLPKIKISIQNKKK